MSAREPCLVCGAGFPAVDGRVCLNPRWSTDLLGCSGCGSYYLSPPLPVEEIEACYASGYHGSFLKTLRKNYIKGFWIGRRLRRWKPDGRFLDVGCALGGLVAGVVRGSGWMGAGTEVTAEAVGAATRLFPEIPFFQGTVDSLPAALPPFDVISISNVLEHVPDPRAFLKVVRSRLVPGGRVELAVPNGPVDIAPNRILYRKHGQPLLTKHGGHLFFFSKAGLHDLFAKAGFRVLSWKAFHVKEALKATGWVPGKLGRFLKRHLPKSGQAAAVAETSKAVRVHGVYHPPSALELGWAGVVRWFRHPCRYALPFGYDYEIVLERTV